MPDSNEELENEFSEWINTDSLSTDAMLDQHQGHGMYIGNRIKLAIPEMIQLKAIVDTAINTHVTTPDPQFFDINTDNIQGLKIPATNKKLKAISVEIEQINGRILVKVGPCDLSGVGGHLVREQIIKDLVNQALQNSGIAKKYEEVNVSACVGVRGRAQMLKSMFVNNRKDDGAHMNAYVKTENEQSLTHWEPRQGPQSFFNDTICGMVTSVGTSLFEKGIRENTIHSSKEATQKILKSPALKEAFDHLLSVAKNRITDLVNSVMSLVGIQQKQIKDELMSNRSPYQTEKDEEAQIDVLTSTPGKDLF